MNKAWAVVAVLCACALPAVANAQFGVCGGGSYGMTCEPPPEPKPVLEFDKDARQDFTPILVLNSLEKAALTKVLDALDKPVAVHAIEKVPLSELVNRLHKATGLRITIDERGLADASIGADLLVMLPVEDATLRTVLDTLSSDHGLGWFPGRGGLVITSQEVRDATFVTAIYPVADLVSSPDGDDYDTILTLITVSIEPNSWKEGGRGEGTVVPYPATGSITIAQPWRIHEQISPLLQGLREAKTQQGIRGLRMLPVARPASPPATPQPMNGGGFF